MIRLIFYSAISICMFVMLPSASFAQQKCGVMLIANIKNDTTKNPGNIPTFTIRIENISTEVVAIPKTTILSPIGRHGFINTIVEEIAPEKSCTEKEFIKNNDDVAPIRCNICSFGRGDPDLSKTVKLLPRQTFTYEEFIYCYNFMPGKSYRVKFSLDSEEIGTGGETDWIYFKIPEEACG